MYDENGKISEGWLEWKRGYGKPRTKKATFDKEYLTKMINAKESTQSSSKIRRSRINNEKIFKTLKINDYVGNLVSQVNSKDYSKKVEMIIQKELYSNRSKGGRKPKLTIKEMIGATVEFLSTETSYLELSKKYELSESNMFETINRVIMVLAEKEILLSTHGREIVVDLDQLNKMYEKIEQLTK